MTTPEKRGAASGTRDQLRAPSGLELSPDTAASGPGGTGTPLRFGKAAVQTEWLLGDGRRAGSGVGCPTWRLRRVSETLAKLPEGPCRGRGEKRESLEGPGSVSPYTHR